MVVHSVSFIDSFIQPQPFHKRHSILLILMSRLWLEILSQVLFKSIATMERRQIRDALTTCGFTDATKLNFIVDDENFDR